MGWEPRLAVAWCQPVGEVGDGKTLLLALLFAQLFDLKVRFVD
jgi:hypothetical protein